MTFEEVLPLLKSGQRIKRAGWKGAWLEMVAGKHTSLGEDYVVAHSSGQPPGPWQAYNDVLADDWEAL